MIFGLKVSLTILVCRFLNSNGIVHVVNSISKTHVPIPISFRCTL